MKICVFARYPRLGHVKSRLAKTCGEEKALRLYEKMLSILFAELSSIKNKICIYYTGCSSAEAREWLGDFEHKVQEEGDLGEKLQVALECEWEKHGKVIFIGVDCLDLSLGDFVEAEALLDKNDVVVGPSEDGGYYLIGFSHFKPGALQGIHWGSSLVFEQTLKRIQEMNCTYQTLSVKRDVDHWEDVPAEWKSEL
jgi:uncharacterized protein